MQLHVQTRNKTQHKFRLCANSARQGGVHTTRAVTPHCRPAACTSSSITAHSSALYLASVAAMACSCAWQEQWLLHRRLRCC